LKKTNGKHKHHRRHLPIQGTERTCFHKKGSRKKSSRKKRKEKKRPGRVGPFQNPQSDDNNAVSHLGTKNGSSGRKSCGKSQTCGRDRSEKKGTSVGASKRPAKGTSKDYTEKEECQLNKREGKGTEALADMLRPSY